LISKNLKRTAAIRVPKWDEMSCSLHRLGLDDDGASILWTARSDVTLGCGKSSKVEFRLDFILDAISLAPNSIFGRRHQCVPMCVVVGSSAATF
jgi:hypothetical protein